MGSSHARRPDIASIAAEFREINRQFLAQDREHQPARFFDDAVEEGSTERRFFAAEIYRAAKNERFGVNDMSHRSDATSKIFGGLLNQLQRQRITPVGGL